MGKETVCLTEHLRVEVLTLRLHIWPTKAKSLKSVIQSFHCVDRKLTLSLDLANINSLKEYVHGSRGHNAQIKQPAKPARLNALLGLRTKISLTLRVVSTKPTLT